MGKLSFIFPGQGSQKIGMLADLAEQHALVDDTFSEASVVLGYDLWDLCQNGEARAINQTEVTQPLLLTASVAIWRLWQHANAPKPQYLAGHSLGEWSALCCAGVVSFEDALKLVQKRGQYMQAAVPAGEGAMYAIVGLDDDKIEAACKDAGDHGVVAAVNFNSPGQVVIAGQVKATGIAAQACKEAGAKRALPLPVSAPFHTSLMQPAADALAVDIGNTSFNAPVIEIIHNASLNVTSNPEEIKQLMVQQVTAPVPWVSTIEKLSAFGVDTLVECGAGKVLSGLMKRIDKSLATHSTDSITSLNSALQAFAE